MAERVSLHDAVRETIAAANADPNFDRVSKRLYFAIQGLEEAIELRPVWGPAEVETIDGGTIPTRTFRGEV